MKEIKIFHDAVKDASAIASRIKKNHKKIIGYLCSYAPEELIYAAGFHPIRLFSSKSDIILAENHLQAYCCSLVRGVLEDSLSGRLDFLDGTVFPHTCDSIQRLSDIWRMNGRYEFFADVILPAKLNTQSAGTYMVDVLTRFKKDLETATGKEITDADLQESIKKFNLIRSNLSKIYAFQSKKPGIIKGTDLYAIVKGSMMMDRDEVADLLPAIVSNLEKTETPASSDKRIIISGSICDSPDIYTSIEKAGGIIVGDDLCTGRRWFKGEIPNDKNPIDAIAERLLDRMICPAKHATPTARAENIVSLARKNKADGVIFILLKFCDPHAFDYPYLKDFLDREGIKNLLIEIDDQQQNLGQLSTRFETFIHYI
ncbi:MAG: 2-hydroxyacyl-CoA dehydratase family protein [Desulfobacula sp.]|uniref:2-hydroxyacyl-CoA dehydratase subunit D n=1 Tax=Desulfobacula sp. TaxID=2593537 RepID=UPI0025BD3D65|nr:2-hydroxyacyl-CoA dehydratase family protein [Desulfobacula sp.]MCD4720322.1 2-hydroxyacyl-CoA dehydratase family protein [Desulfobacula sp.]